MSADYSQLTEFTRNLERLNDAQKDQFFKECCKELAARLLSKVVRRTPSSSGVLRRGWTAGSGNAVAYANSLEVRKVGNTYQVDIINPVEYASYVEYGHRTRNHTGWVEGKFMLTISEQELSAMTDRILQRKLENYLRDVFGR